jgi:hypothetical protein
MTISPVNPNARIEPDSLANQSPLTQQAPSSSTPPSPRMPSIMDVTGRRPSATQVLSGSNTLPMKLNPNETFNIGQDDICIDPGKLAHLVRYADAGAFLPDLNDRSIIHDDKDALLSSDAIRQNLTAGFHQLFDAVLKKYPKEIDDDLKAALSPDGRWPQYLKKFENSPVWNDDRLKLLERVNTYFGTLSSFSSGKRMEVLNRFNLPTEQFECLRGTDEILEGILATETGQNPLVTQAFIASKAKLLETLPWSLLQVHHMQNILHEVGAVSKATTRAPGYVPGQGKTWLENVFVPTLATMTTEHVNTVFPAIKKILRGLILLTNEKGGQLTEEDIQDFQKNNQNDLLHIVPRGTMLHQQNAFFELNDDGTAYTFKPEAMIVAMGKQLFPFLTEESKSGIAEKNKLPFQKAQKQAEEAIDEAASRMHNDLLQETSYLTQSDLDAIKTAIDNELLPQDKKDKTLANLTSSVTHWATKMGDHHNQLDGEDDGIPLARRKILSLASMEKRILHWPVTLRQVAHDVWVKMGVLKSKQENVTPGWDPIRTDIMIEQALTDAITLQTMREAVRRANEAAAADI